MRADGFQLFLITVFGLVLTVGTSFGQAVKIEVSDPTFEDLQSPNIDVSGVSKRWDPKDWLEVEVEIELDARPVPADGYLDRLQIRWFVAVKNPAGKGFFLLEKEVTYVNIPIKEKVFASVYLSPSAIKRLTGGERAGKNAVEAVGGEGTVNGKTEAFSEGLKAGWWKSGSLSRSDKFPLLTKKQTPFATLWWDRYIQEEVRR